MYFTTLLFVKLYFCSKSQELKETFSYIKFTKDVDVYNADSTMQDHHGQRIRKQGGFIKVDKLLYLWVPAENKAELFYHLKGHQFYATQPDVSEKIDVGDGYVKSSEVKFVYGIKLKPSNTAQDAEKQAHQDKTN